MAVKMIDFVLNTAAHEGFSLNNLLLTIQINTLGPRVPCTLRGEPKFWHRKATFIAILVLILGEFHDDRVEDVINLAINIPRERTQGDANLVGGETSAAFVVDILQKVFNQATDAGSNLLDRCARGAENRISYNTNLAKSHRTIVSHPGSHNTHEESHNIRERPGITSGPSLAPAVGLEPTTVRLTVECSAIELRGNGNG